MNNRIQVIKRSGNVVDFDPEKITKAVLLAMNKVSVVDENIAEKIGTNIEELILKDKNDFPVRVHIEEIQDMVEDELVRFHLTEAVKEYVTYRAIKNLERSKRKELDRDDSPLKARFINRYKKLEPPFSPLGSFVYNRTYSRNIEPLNRREFFFETIARACKYNCSLRPTSEKEAEALYNNLFHMKQYLAGRTYWTGNSKASKYYPTSNFNCAGIVASSIESILDYFYLLSVGAGVGVRILKEDIKKFPKIVNWPNVVHIEPSDIKKEVRNEYTILEIDSEGKEATLIIGDSREGWIQSLECFLKVYMSPMYRKIKTLLIDYSHIREAGMPLRTFGGTASGYKTMKTMFEAIDRIFNNKYDTSIRPIENGNLRPIHVLDLINVIARNIVAGNVRRSSCIALFSPDDEEVANAKTDPHKVFVEMGLDSRAMSNNTMFFEERPSLDKIKQMIETIKLSGEPGFLNAEAARKRRPDFEVVNPCGEVLLSNKGLCNLTTLNCYNHLIDYNDADNDKKDCFLIDYESILESQRLSARAAFRMTNIELELPDWDKVQKEHMLTGCSLTGFMDCLSAMNNHAEDNYEVIYNTIINNERLKNKCNEFLEKKQYKQKIEDLNLPELFLLGLHMQAWLAIEDYCNELGIENPHKNNPLITTVKPEGTLTLLSRSTSQGIHCSYAEYYIRRVRISKYSPLVDIYRKKGYPVLNEINDENDTTRVIEFPCKAVPGMLQKDLTAIQKLEIYKMFMRYYVDHNASNTIPVRNDEWDGVIHWIYDNWDDIVAITLINGDDFKYELAPYEEITKEEYDRRMEEIKTSTIGVMVQNEDEEEEDASLNECGGGHCPIR